MPAKVEGRDPPDKAKGTMAPFKSLMGRLLKVPMSEVKEQQALYEAARHDVDRPVKAKKVAGLFLHDKDKGPPDHKGK